MKTFVHAVRTSLFCQTVKSFAFALFLVNTSFAQMPTTIEGTVQLMAVDDIDPATGKITGKMEAFLNGDNGEVIPLDGTLTKQITPGQRVSGVITDDGKTLQKVNVLPMPFLQDEANGAVILKDESNWADTIGVQRTLVVLLNYQDVTEKSFTLEMARAVLEKANTFVLDNSNGAAWIDATILDWNTLPSAYSYYTGDGCTDRFKNDALSLIHNYPFIYDRLIFIAATAPDNCFFGRGTVGKVKILQNGQVQRASIAYMTSAAISNNNERNVLSHELGHNFGFSHASSILCSQLLPPALYQPKFSNYSSPYTLIQPNSVQINPAISPLT